MELRNAKTYDHKPQVVIVFSNDPFVCFNVHADGVFHCRYKKFGIMFNIGISGDDYKENKFLRDATGADADRFRACKDFQLLRNWLA